MPLEQDLAIYDQGVKNITNLILKHHLIPSLLLLE